MKPLRQHQREMCRFLWDRDLTGLNGSEPGLGKTRETLELVRQGLRQGRVTRVLVVAPVLLARTVWPEEIEKWTPELSWRLLWTQRTKDRLVVGDETVQITSFETFKILVKRGVLKPSMFDLLVVDESSKLKDVRSQISRAVRAFAQAMNPRRALLLSGTPAPNSPVEYWPQLACVASDKVGGFYSWRARWTVPTGHGEWRGKGNNVRLAPEREERFAEHLRDCGVLIHRKGEWLMDLPPIQFVRRTVPLTPRELTPYLTMEREMMAVLEDGGRVEASIVLAQLAKLRQLSRGFVYSGDGERFKVARTGTTIFDAAVDILESEWAGRPAVVFCNFNAERDALLPMLKSARCGTGDPEAIEAWKRGEFLHLLLHPKSAGHGLTLTRATEMLWVSPTFSLEEWEQACARLHRISQEGQVTVMSLLASSTVDARIVAGLEAKRTVSDSIKTLIRRAA